MTTKIADCHNVPEAVEHVVTLVQHRDGFRSLDREDQGFIGRNRAAADHRIRNDRDRIVMFEALQDVRACSHINGRVMRVLEGHAAQFRIERR